MHRLAIRETPSEPLIALTDLISCFHRTGPSVPAGTASPESIGRNLSSPPRLVAAGNLLRGRRVFLFFLIGAFTFLHRGPRRFGIGDGLLRNAALKHVIEKDLGIR